MLERISNWVVLMFENRSFDSLLGHLPHIAADGGIRDREIVLRYPGEEAPVVRPAVSAIRTPIPGPGLRRCQRATLG